MRRSLEPAAALCLFALTTFGQDVRFLAADVHESPKTQNQSLRPPSARGELFQAKYATLADLIAFAYDSNVSKVLGGPNWLEMDRFDIFAKQPSQTAVEVQRRMLRALLAERFNLVASEETRPVPAFILIDGKNRKIKEADGSGETGCKPQSASSTASASGTLRVSMAGADGTPVQLSLENGMIEYKCRNITMAAFAGGLRGMIGTNLGLNPVVDQTGLAGTWNFDLRYSLGFVGLPGAGLGEVVTIFDAIEKQLGLKLDEKPVPTAVVVVTGVDAKPTANPPGTIEALPRTSVPTEFEVATIKATSPDSRRTSLQTQPGRFVSEGLPLALLISRAFSPLSSGQLVGMPSWADSTRFDVNALVSTDGTPVQLDADTLAPLLLGLLKDRFKLTYHTEQRELPAYDLVAEKPKMKKADSASRSWCKNPNQVPGAAPAPSGSQAMICQNITMSQFAETLRGRSSELQTPVQDATGLEGGWDFRLTYNPLSSLATAAALRAPVDSATPAPLASALEPTIGNSLFEAVEKQLGLKLEKTKRASPVTVIDHLEREPTEN